MYIIHHAGHSGIEKTTKTHYANRVMIHKLKPRLTD